MARSLRLGGLLETLDLRLQEARGNNLSHDEFLEIILQDELNIREQRQIHRRIKTATFRDLKTLENFDFGFNPSLKRKAIYDLASCQFIRQQRDVLLVGPPGVGKSHIAQAIGHQAIKANFLVLYRSVFDAVRELMAEGLSEDQDRTMRKYLKPDLLIIDDMGMKHLTPTGRRIPLRGDHATLREPLNHDDQQPPHRGVGKAHRRCAIGNRYP
jgi:DNA replication protein DnaC